MKIEHDKDGFVLKEVFSGVKLVTAEGNAIGVCMRDDTFEINVIGKDGSSKWFRVDPHQQTINQGIGDRIGPLTDKIMLFREHRGGFEESLATLQHVRDLVDVSMIVLTFEQNLNSSLYMAQADAVFDERARCLTCAVRSNRGVHGYMHFYDKEDPRPIALLKKYGRELRAEQSGSGSL